MGGVCSPEPTKSGYCDGCGTYVGEREILSETLLRKIKKVVEPCTALGHQDDVDELISDLNQELYAWLYDKWEKFD